jgi:tetratricopeptide (TPR) repeat protein
MSAGSDATLSKLTRAKLLRGQGDALYAIGRHSEALSRFQAVLTLHDADYEVWTLHGFCLAALKQFEASIESFNQAIARCPTYGLAWHGKGHALAKLSHFEEAVTHLERAVKLSPGDNKAWYNLGTAQNQLRRYRDAVASFEHSLKLSPQDHRARYNQGVALCGLHRYEDALQVLHQALGQKPNAHYIWNQQGTVLIQMGRYSEAIQSFDISLSHQTQNPNAWYGKARAYAMAGDLEQTLKNLYRTFVLSPYVYRVMVQIDAHFDTMRHHPRFKRLVEGTQ